MAERIGFRDNLVRLDEAFPSCEMLSKKQVGEYLGLNYKTVVKLFKFKCNFISKIQLAKELS